MLISPFQLFLVFEMLPDFMVAYAYFEWEILQLGTTLFYELCGPIFSFYIFFLVSVTGLYFYIYIIMETKGKL